MQWFCPQTRENRIFEFSVIPLRRNNPKIFVFLYRRTILKVHHFRSILICSPERKVFVADVGTVLKWPSTHLLCACQWVSLIVLACSFSKKRFFNHVAAVCIVPFSPTYTHVPCRCEKASCQLSKIKCMHLLGQ